jgi:hypothetical protein
MNMKILLVSLKTLTKLKKCSGRSQAGYGTTCRDTGGYQNARTRQQALCRGLPEEISQLVSDFIGASRNFYFDLLHKKTLEIMKTISAHSS